MQAQQHDRFASERTGDAAVERLFDEICQLRMDQLTALNRILCSRLHLKVIGSFAQTIQTAAKAPAEPEKLVATIVSFGADKVASIKAARAILGMGLKESKDFVEGLPKALGAAETQAEAEKAAQPWIDAGFAVELS